MKRCTYALVALSAALIIAPAFAEQNGAPKEKGHKPPPPHEIPLLPKRAADRLDLTDDQKAKIDVINKKFDEERDAWLAKNKPDEKLKNEMKAAREAGDKEKMKALREEMRAKMQPLWELRQSYLKQVNDILTPAQRTELDEMKAEAREKRKERMDEHGDKPHKHPHPHDDAPEDLEQ